MTPVRWFTLGLSVLSLAVSVLALISSHRRLRRLRREAETPPIWNRRRFWTRDDQEDGK